MILEKACNERRGQIVEGEKPSAHQNLELQGRFEHGPGFLLILRHKLRDHLYRSGDKDGVQDADNGVDNAEEAEKLFAEESGQAEVYGVAGNNEVGLGDHKEYNASAGD